MSEMKGRRARHYGTGFYIALFLGVTALAVAGYWTLLSQGAEEEPASSNAELEVPTEDVTEMPEWVVEPETEPETEPAEELPVFDASAITIAPVAPQLIVDPLKGETLAVFSVDALSYNETLGDWRTHDGVDIAAELGTHVLAACAGTVSTIADDDLMGTTVTITHDGGYETVYANLQSVPTVAVGDSVSAGQTIGSVGDTAISESTMRPHLHFAVYKGGVPYDPEDFLQ